MSAHIPDQFADDMYDMGGNDKPNAWLVYDQTTGTVMPCRIHDTYRSAMLEGWWMPTQDNTDE